jgi:glycosyltransferase involved in cell wall biosynthesis
VKYWLLTTEYPPQFGGGIGTYCKQWAEELDRNGDFITIFIPNSSIRKFAVRYEGKIRIVEFSPYLMDTSSFLGFETMQSYSFAEIIKIFIEKEGVPDWLEAQEYNGIAYFILQRKNLGEKLFVHLKVLVTCHAPSFLYFEFNHINTYKLPYFWIGEMEKYCIQTADVCISPSQYLVDQLQERLDSKRIFHVLHNPYKVLEQRCETELTNKAVFLAKLSPSKGILQTLQCFEKLWKQKHSIKLTLIGDKNFFYHAKQCMMGDLIYEKYSTYIKQGLLTISGALSPVQVREEIKTAQVVIVPSTVDNFPYTVVECMSSGKAVLASKQGGHKEIIEHRKNGFLFDHENEGEFEDMVLELFALNKEQINEMGSKAASTIKNTCDPEAYYIHKSQLLNRFNNTDAALIKDRFVFTRIDSKVRESERSGNHLGIPGLLSVVVPYYNMGDYVEETIRSIQSSTYKNIEIIIVNDGSAGKKHLDIIQKLSEEYQINVISQSNMGLSEARNKGALYAKGEFLAFLDADDLVHTDYYSKAVDVLKSKVNVHFVGCWVEYFEGSKAIWPSFNPEPPFLLYHNMLNSSGLVYVRRSFLDAGLNDKRFLYGMEDYDSVLSLVENNYGGVVIPDSLFFYRVRKGSMARGFNENNQSYLYQLLAQKHRTLFVTFAAEITSLLNANGPGFKIDNPTLDYHLYRGASAHKYLRGLYTFIKHKPLLRNTALTMYKFFKN